MDLHRLHGRGWRLGAVLLGVGLIGGLLPNAALAARVSVVYAQQPGNATFGIPFGTQPVIEIHRPNGSVDTLASGTITLSITAGTGAPGAILACTTNPVVLAAGVATFAGCAIDRHVTGYRLTQQ